MVTVRTMPGESDRSGVLTCWPGPRAAAGLVGAELTEAHLMLMLDPVTIALVLPPNRAGWPAMARLLREVAASAGVLADRIDPDGLMQPAWADQPPTDHGEASGEVGGA